ncbi:unnamed protein product [Symbiodinium microadriaticum]|nr:unnamed protein product [Symbiodinium microadriaticum]
MRFASRRLQLSPSRARDLEVTVSPGLRLGRAQLEIGSLTEDIDHMRSELKFLQRDLSKAPPPPLGASVKTISTMDTARLLDSCISDKVDAMKLDLDTERRQRLAREEDARARLQNVQQSSDAHAAHQFHTDGRVRKMEEAMAALENRLEMLFQDLDQGMKKRKEGEDALWLALQEVRESLGKEAQQRAARDEELSREDAGLAQLLEQERSERRKAEDVVGRDRKAELLRVASVEAQVAQAAETLDFKFHSLKELLDGEKTARSGMSVKLEHDLADLGVAVRGEKDAMERRLAAFQQACDKDVEEKLRGHRQGMETLIDRKLSELKESVEQGFTLAKQNRESIQFAMDRERESRKAQSETLLASLEARLEPVLSRLGQAERQAEALSSKAERTLQEHQRLQASVEERAEAERRDLQTWRVELDVLKKKSLEAEEFQKELKKVKDALELLPSDLGGGFKKLEKRCGSLETELHQALEALRREASERAARLEEASTRLEERLRAEEDFRTKLKQAMK